MTTSTPDRAPDRADGGGVQGEGSRTTVTVDRPAEGGRLRVGMHAVGGPDRPLLRPMLVAADERTARVALVPEGALLLAGDVLTTRVRVGPGAALELLEPAGTVAYDMRGGSARWDVHVELAVGATLVWHGEPFVAASGSEVDRRTIIDLAPTARLALRETLVLGRYGEWPGTLRSRLEARVDGAPVLVEDLGLAPDTAGMLLGGHRVLGSVLLLGADLPGDPGPDRFDLEGGGTLVRRLAAEAHQAVLADTWAQARATVRLP